MHRFISFAAAVALGLVWSIGPAFAADDKTEADRKVEQAERKLEKAEDKAQHEAVKAEDKVEGTKDTVKDKAVRAKDTVKEKAVSAKDKVKDTFTRAKDKVRDKTERADHASVMADTRAAQQALRTEGFDPGPIDGVMGPRTEAALRDYQRAHELQDTGRLDEPTMAKLNVRAQRGTEMPAASPTTQPDPAKQVR
jgi:hypothetical protein